MTYEVGHYNLDEPRKGARFCYLCLCVSWICLSALDLLVESVASELDLGEGSESEGRVEGKEMVRYGMEIGRASCRERVL